MAKPLLILDIDETLIHAADYTLDRPCAFRVAGYHVYVRPYIDVFLKRISRYYDIACWSSATPDYVEAILAEVLPDIVKPVFVWDRRRCTRRYDHTLWEHYFLKDLKKVRRKGFDLNRVLILEDDPKKVWRNYGNAVYVKPYLGEEADDDELLILSRYLESIHEVENFRRLEKRFWRGSV